MCVLLDAVLKPWSTDEMTCDVSARQLTGSDPCSLPNSMHGLHDLLRSHTCAKLGNKELIEQ